MILNVIVVNGSEYCLTVDAKETVLDVKKKIQAISNIPAHRLRIIYKSKQLDDHNRSLADYHLDGEQEKVYVLNGRLDPVFIITIFMIMLTKSVELKVNSSTTILDIKRMIEMSQGISVSRQCIICNGTRLKDCTMLEKENIDSKDKLLLFDTGIEEGNDDVG